MNLIPFYVPNFLPANETKNAQTRSCLSTDHQTFMKCNFCAKWSNLIETFAGFGETKKPSAKLWRWPGSVEEPIKVSIKLSPLDQGWKSCPVINSAAIFFPLIDLGVHRFNYEIASHGQSLLGLTWHVMFYYGLQWLALSSQSLT